MPSATWAPANSAELRWEQLGLERRVQVQRGGEREKDKGERGGGRLKGREREAKKEGRERGTWREACGRPYSTTWESSGLHTSEAAKSTGEHTHTHQNRADKKKKAGKITSALRGQYKNQHMLAGYAWAELSIIIFVIITTERELDQDTCREGVDTAARK